MNKTRFTTALVAILLFEGSATAQIAAKVAKAPYVTDATQATAQAAESGKHALIYFSSPT